MGLSRWFYVEPKSFKFDMEVGVPVLRIFESRSYMRSVSLGKASILWLLAVMEEVLNTEVAKEFFKKNRAGSKVFFGQRNANRSGHFLVISEYGGGGWHNSIVIPAG